MSARPAEPYVSDTWSTGRLIMPLRPLTVAEYLAIGEIEPGYTELVEGRIVMSPGPMPRHGRGQVRLIGQLDACVPSGLEALPEVDIDLALSGADSPGWSRRPDIVVAPRTAFDRIDREGGMLTASEVVLVIEIVSAGSRRTDHVTKRGEYADAGIPRYWIVDLEDRVSMTALHLAGEFGYADDGVVTGTFSATEPFPVELDLDALVRA